MKKFFCPKCQVETKYIQGRYGLQCSICGCESFIDKDAIDRFAEEIFKDEEEALENVG